MHIELLEIRDFLAQHPPFDKLDGDALDALPRQLQIRYVRRGQTFPPDDSPAFYILRQGAVELRDRNGELFEKLGEGDHYALPCSEDHNALPLHGIASEDSLVYVLVCERFFALCHEHKSFDDYFNESLRKRLHRALQRDPTDTAASALDMAVQQLLHRAPVTVSPDSSIKDTARLMNAETVSAVMIIDQGKLLGLVTDRDMRSRCIADGMDTAAAVSRIMSGELHTIHPATTVSEALLIMSRENLHHLPVLDQNKPLGMISRSDIIRLQRSNPMHLISAIHKAHNVSELQELGRQLPEVERQNLAAGHSAAHTAHVVSSIGDALTRRLIALHREQSGAAPIEFAWLAVGSLARQELTAHSDQDNALLLSDAYREAQHGSYFAGMAQFVCDGLAGCGIQYCPGEVMASNPQWRQPLKTWQHYFANWTRNPERKAMMLVSNFFDMRVIDGNTGLFNVLNACALKEARGNGIFLTHLAANALQNRPPLGFFRQFVLVHGGEHDKHFDLKLRGILPIVDLARLFALSEGIAGINTMQRLQQAELGGALSHEGAANLRDALELICAVRLRHQVQQHVQAEAVDNFVDPARLSPLERTHLKDAFAAIRVIQDAVAQRFQTERIG